MNKPLVVSSAASETPSRSARARSEAERLRRDAQSAQDGSFLIHADRMREIADLLESLARRNSRASLAITRVPAPESSGPVTANRVEQDLATLLMRSAQRARD